MKISDVVGMLEEFKGKHGDIDVVCVVPGCSSDWEAVMVDRERFKVFDTEDVERRLCGVDTDKYVLIGID